MSFKNDKEFDAKLMNFDGDRYDVVVLASMWAKELKKKDWDKYSDEEKQFINTWSSRFSDDFGTTTEDTEFKYLKPGDYFEDDRILIINTEEKYLVTMTEYGYVRIYLINSCYSASKATGLINCKL